MKEGSSEGMAMRCADAAELATALSASRRDTLATYATCDQALGGRRVPQRVGLNPLLWELGHIGWFQEFWIARNPQRERGIQAAADIARPAGVRADSDALYDSSRVAHASRWHLALPDAAATRDDLAAQLDASLALLRQSAGDDDSLYFFRLALFHEDMHHEAALYMAQALGIAVDDPRWRPSGLPAPNPSIEFEAGHWQLGARAGGFAFDNELAAHTVEVGRCRIDSRVVRWAEYLPFIEAEGYRDMRWWSADGQAWLARHRLACPRVLRRSADGWARWCDGRWSALDEALPACHLTAYEAQAWCAWAGRRLPTEAEWERTALSAAERFRWGDVWEWTASPFAPYPGFAAHPYRDYSVPWFDGRPVLRGASFATQPRMRHPVYRNYFPADRNDIFAGFRSCET